MLSPPNDLYSAILRDLGALSAFLIPDPAVLASVDQFKVRVVDSVGDLSQGCIPCVGTWRNVTTVWA